MNMNEKKIEINGNFRNIAITLRSKSNYSLSIRMSESNEMTNN